MEDRWAKLEEIVRRVVREEVAAIKTRPKREREAFTGFTAEQVAAWKAAFPAVDVDAEILKMKAWITANPAEAPKSQFGRFAHTWLTRQHNQASLRSIPTARPAPTPPNLCEYCLAPATASIGGIRSCDRHTREAMDRAPRPKMPGQVARAVAGAD